MMFQTISALLFASALALCVGCGGEAELGSACDTAGATDECVEGGICTNEPDETFVCRKVCTDQAECGQNEDCNGVSGSNIKSCQPK